MKWGDVIKLLKIQITVNDCGGNDGYIRVKVKIPSMRNIIHFTYTKKNLVGNPHFFVYQQTIRSFELEKWIGEEIEFCYEDTNDYLYKN